MPDVMSERDGGPAFPVFNTNDHPEEYRGLSKREYMEIEFAKAWIQALGERYYEFGYSDNSAADHALYMAAYMADTMLCAGEEPDETL